MLSEALSYPQRGDGWLVRILIGGILYFLGFLIIPLLLIEGYLYRVLARATRGDTNPPDWEDWVELLVEGIKMWVIQIGYFVIPLIVGIVGFALLAMDMTGVGSLVLLITGVLAILVLYLLPAGLSNFAYTGEIGAAFDFETIRSVAFTGSYFVHVVVALVVGIILGVIGSMLSVILIGVFVLFYSQVVVYVLWARGFSAGLGTATV